MEIDTECAFLFIGLHGDISTVRAPIMCLGLPCCFSSLNSPHSMGMILFSRFHKLGNLRDVTYLRLTKPVIGGAVSPPPVLSIPKAYVYSAPTSLCLSGSDRWRRLFLRRLPWHPAGGQCWCGCLRQVSIVACASGIGFPFWLLYILEIHSQSQ